jgi:hypothetical protein
MWDHLGYVDLRGNAELMYLQTLQMKFFWWCGWSKYISVVVNLLLVTAQCTNKIGTITILLVTAQDTNKIVTITILLVTARNTNKIATQFFLLQLGTPTKFVMITIFFLLQVRISTKLSQS